MLVVFNRSESGQSVRIPLDKIRTENQLFELICASSDRPKKPTVVGDALRVDVPPLCGIVLRNR